MQDRWARIEREYNETLRNRTPPPNPPPTPTPPVTPYPPVRNIEVLNPDPPPTPPPISVKKRNLKPKEEYKFKIDDWFDGTLKISDPQTGSITLVNTGGKVLNIAYKDFIKEFQSDDEAQNAAEFRQGLLDKVFEGDAPEINAKLIVEIIAPYFPKIFPKNKEDVDESPYSVEDLERLMETCLHEFRRKPIKQKPTVHIIKPTEEGEHFGEKHIAHYEPSTNNICFRTTYLKRGSLEDITDTMFHELVHAFLHQSGTLFHGEDPHGDKFQALCSGRPSMPSSNMNTPS